MPEFNAEIILIVAKAMDICEGRKGIAAYCLLCAAANTLGLISDSADADKFETGLQAALTRFREEAEKARFVALEENRKEAAQ